MAKYKVVITDYNFKTAEIEKQELSALDAEVITDIHCRTEEEVIDTAGDADAIIVQYAPITRRVIENLKRCKIIVVYGIGTNNIDVECATEHNILVANVPHYCIEEVSDHTILLLLAIARKVTVLNNAVKAGTWDFKISKPVYRLRGKRLGLVGYGNIARKTAEKAKGFGLAVGFYDPYVPEESVSGHDVIKMPLDEILSTSDFVSIHIPSTKDTRHMFGMDYFRKMKETAFLINVSRGDIIDEKDLVQALKEHMIAGAAMDVCENEPAQPGNPLFKMDNVIITPHMAWYSEESGQELQRTAARQVVQCLSGNRPDHPVNTL